MTYQQQQVIDLDTELVFVKVNAEKDTVLAQKYGIAGFPTIILTKSDGSEIDRIYGYSEGDDFVNTIRDYMADRNTLADYLRRADTAATMQLYYMIGDKYVGRKKFTDAQTYYEKIVQMDPDNAQGYSDSALYSLGEMFTRAKEYDKAIAAYQKFTNVYPQSGLADNAMYQIGVTLRRAEKYDDAIAQFRSFIEANPESDLVPDAEIYIAFCNDKKGDGQEAVRLYKQFLEDHPDSRDTSWVKQQIDKILNPPEEKEKGSN